MQLLCKACNKPIANEEINIDLGIAKCLACNEVFSFLEDLGGTPRIKPLAELPKRFKVENWGADVVITWPWYKHSVWFLLLFCLFWDGFLVVWYGAGVYALTHDSGGSPFVWMMLVFPVLHVAVGAALTYLVACTFINKTVIRAGAGEFTVRHGPLPAPGNLHLFSTDIKQLYCAEKRHRGEESVRITYNVMAVKRDDTRLLLVSGFEQLDQALFIEQQLEHHLKLRDERVPEEVRY
jgi:hypothetical protein